MSDAEQYAWILPVAMLVTAWVNAHFTPSPAVRDILLPGIVFLSWAAIVYAPVILPPDDLERVTAIFAGTLITTGVWKTGKITLSGFTAGVDRKPNT